MIWMVMNHRHERRNAYGEYPVTVKGGDARYRSEVPGEYKLYCSIHPVLMSQVVRVR